MGVGRIKVDSMLKSKHEMPGITNDSGLNLIWYLSADGIQRITKRLVDLSMAFLGLVILTPVMIVVAILIKLDSPGPVIFKQERCGLGGKSFKMLKFRSMRTDAEADSGPTWAAEDDPRITRMGGYLRKSRLDEVPQLINVIRGEMSLVGPRPERPWFVERLAQTVPNYQLRHTVKPGITGEAQIFVGYDTCYEDVVRKVQHDLSYIRNKGILHDFKLLVQTVSIISTGHGAR